MSQRIITVKTCDQCPDTAAPVLDTYRFSVGSDSYETELCAEHKIRFDKEISPYIENARRLTAARRITGLGPVRDRHSDSAKLKRDARAWGIANGKPVSNRGRIAESLISEYREYLAKSGA